MSDSFVQLQPDGTGKQIDVESQTTTAGNVYTQRARFVGTSQDVLDEIYRLSILEVTLLRMINTSLSTKVLATEDDFLDPALSFEDDLISTSQDLG